MRVLEGHEELLRVTSDFPKMGRLPGMNEILGKKWEEQPGISTGPVATASAAVAVVVVVVCVAVAARPSVVADEELLRAKLLDVYSPVERQTLREAVSMVRNNPDLVKATMGIDHSALGKDFIGNLNKVEEILI